ncbi:MAG: hypothetical protein QOI64_957 [Solirubrobacteraceae bacterium]|jgi:hypothetical protein|nr:hypothetical protein [Solirubrobacteraceae bacterium]
MAADDRVYLHIALEPDGEVISGTVCTGDSGRLEFSGWLELMSVFEGARATARAAAARGRGRGRSSHADCR